VPPGNRKRRSGASVGIETGGCTDNSLTPQAKRALFSLPSPHEGEATLFDSLFCDMTFNVGQAVSVHSARGTATREGTVVSVRGLKVTVAFEEQGGDFNMHAYSPSELYKSVAF